MARPGVRSVIGLGVLCALVGGFAVGVVLTEPEAPADLRSAEALGVVPVTDRVFDDERSVTVQVTVADVTAVGALAAGRVTSSTCAPGIAVGSGSTTVAVDGRALINLNTALPLWRDLAVGDRGRDVDALHGELRRLGYAAPEGDRVTRATVTAYRAFAQALGAAEPIASVIDHTGVVWLPEPIVTVGSCGVRVGAQVALGDPLFELPGGVGTAVVTPLPDGATVGDRVLIIDDQPVPVGSDGVVADPAALLHIAQSRMLTEALAADPANPQISATWRLAEPLTVLVVPPSAVLGVGGPATCVVGEDGETLDVTIVGSQLGQTFVVPAVAAARPGVVQASPDPALTCGSP